MVFNGIEEAPKLTVAPCGLLSVARVVKHDGEDEHWLNEFTAELDGFPSISVQTNVGNDSYVIYDGSTAEETTQVLPFWIELNKKMTSVNFIREGFDGPFLDQIDAATQKAVERELWEGEALQSNTPAGTGHYLVEQNGATIVTTAGVDAEKALWLLEQEISKSPTGARGIIHMTRDVASALGSRLRYFEKNEIDEKTYAVTRLGTLVVIGSGYTGNGPIGATGRDATATNKWMFVTGAVEVHLGKADFVNKDLAQALNPRVNDFEVQVLRPAAVHFDPSIFSAAQVTLP